MRHPQKEGKMDSEITKIIKATTKKTIAQEIAAIESLPPNLNISSIVIAVQAILYNPDVNVFACGMGKSGLVSRIFVSKLRTIGHPAFYLNPAEAMHGELGAVRHGDIIVFFSKSGETKLLCDLIPVLNKAKHQIITITCNRHSTLYHAADIAVHIPITIEADNINMLPTNSAITMVAVSDAIVVSIMAVRGFDVGQYKTNHPA